MWLLCQCHAPRLCARAQRSCSQRRAPAIAGLMDPARPVSSRTFLEVDPQAD